jgi:D-cysteine desulfhydrase
VDVVLRHEHDSAAPVGERAVASRPLFERYPKLAARVRLARLAELPTPIERLVTLERALGSGGELFAKRDDRTSPIYGGNKVRTLEVLFGDALAREATHVYATGACGSNHATATALHAPRIGLVPGAVVYPQPESRSAAENLRVLLDRAGAHLRALPHWSALPYGIVSERRRAASRGERAVIMMPGGAIPLGALGYVSAGLELAEQIESGCLPRPARIVVAIGSNCTSAGLLVGFALATRVGLGFRAGSRPRPPTLVAVRVTPWPVTSRLRVLHLAHATARLVAELAGEPRFAFERRELSALLELDGTQLGPGYGHGTDAGREAAALFAEHAGLPLELTYSGKSAAATLARLRARAAGPTLYWATKSSAPLPEVENDALARAPAGVQRWLARALRAEPVS